MKRLALALCLLLSLPVYGKVLLALRSWPRDPDLPTGLPDTSLPANWNPGSPDWYQSTGTTLTNGTVTSTLQNLFDNFDSGANTLQPGDQIRLAAGEDYGTIVIPADVKGTASEWVIVYSDGYASLPAYGSRVVEADATYMATFSRAPTAAVQPALDIQGGDGTIGASYIRLIGIQIKATGSGYAGTNYIGPFNVGNVNEYTPANEMPTNIGFDRCIVTVDDDVHPWGNTFDCKDSFVIGCCFHNLWGGGNDGSNSLRSNDGYRLLVDNNSFESMGAAWFLGSNDLVTVEDAKFSNNYHERPTAWNDGGHGTHKASFETKVGLRVLVENNVFVNQWNTSFEAISIKAEGTGGPKDTTHVTIRGNKITGATRGILLHVGGSSSDDDVGPNADMLVEDNLCLVNVTDREVLRMVFSNQWGTLKRIQVRNNTLINTASPTSYTIATDGYSTDGSTPGENLIFRDNITSYYNVQNGQEGSWALNWSFGSTYVATYNLWIGRTVGQYDDDTDPLPLGTLTNSSFPADLAAVGFTDTGNGDYSLGGGSSYLTSSSTGGKPGYDSDTYDPIWAGVEP